VLENGRDPHRVARSQALLQEMRKLYHSGVREVKPNVATYNSLIQVLIKSDDPSAAGEQAEKYLQEMKNENIKPNKFVHTSMIKAWSKRTDPNAKERIKALKSEMKQLHQQRR
jgi:hypothetical protein